MLCLDPKRTLFVLTVDYILIDCTESGTQIGEGKQLGDLDSADDIALMKSNKTKLQDLLNTVHENSGQLGLKINTEKTKEHGNN